MIRMSRCICSCLFVCLWITTGVQPTVAQDTRQLEERIERLEKKIDQLTALIERLLAERAGSRMTDVQAYNEDRRAVAQAKANLATIRNGLGMYQAESDNAAYPETVTIQGYQSLAEVLSAYGQMPPAEVASWTFVSYARPAPDRFLMSARARDTNRTVVWISPTGISLHRPPPLKEQ